MSYIFAIVAIPVILALLVWAFVSSEPKSIVRFFRYFFPVIFIACGVLLTVVGRGAYGVPALVLGLIWWWDIARRIRIDREK